MKYDLAFVPYLELLHTCVNCFKVCIPYSDNHTCRISVYMDKSLQSVYSTSSIPAYMDTLF